ncbi:MAG: preprotein translocase subunit SecA, partial [Acutalibacteraceae bacterium]|nr:preprotein translocase subunit SecA [Acutalibacteraceae bacterium]
MSLLTKIFGDYSSKEVKRVMPIQKKVLSYEDEYSRLSDEELKAKTPEFKERLKNGETLDDILPEAFAVCREASSRVLNMKHFPVQIIGGIILHQGRIAEMKTGEGKTLVATLPAYLNALSGKGVHIVTVNDYLARRDSEWMGKLYRFLGLSVGLIVHELNNDERRAAYSADITYGTNNEMGFDYLRDNMIAYAEQRVQRGHSFAIVDEVDSILIDEARTPLIISGVGDKSTDLYKIADSFAKTLKKVTVKELDSKQNAEEELSEDGDFVVDEKAKTATLTKSGIAKAEAYFNLENLMDSENITVLHHIEQAIKAIGVMKRDVDYVVKDGEVLIVDEFTGRIMLGRRYSEGLHQAIEAKEGVKVERESKTLATITFQNYFRLYDKLSGMTGTAMTESTEFQEIYSLDVISIPTNKPMIRIDDPDVLYKTEQAKFNAIIDRIIECHENGQPVLVGTISIEKSEALSKALKKRGIKHEVLNAKYHEKEAEIIAQAGKFGAVTIATNMAGRGTDIILGGNPEYMAKAEMRKKGYSDELIAEATGYAETSDEEILEARKTFRELENKHKEELKDEAAKVRNAGGLYIIGTERHESRRIDNQLRGRSGRQGDPGHSQFFLSAEDDLLRLFAGDRFYNILNNFKAVGDMPIEAGILSKSIESAQKKVEANNFATRRNVLEFDDVMNEQRKKIYSERNQVLDGADLHETIQKMINDYFDSMVQFYCPSSLPENEWNLAGMKTKLGWIIGSDSLDELKTPDDYLKYFLSKAEKLYNDRKQ